MTKTMNTARTAKYSSHTCTLTERNTAILKEQILLVNTQLNLLQEQLLQIVERRKTDFSLQYDAKLLLCAISDCTKRINAIIPQIPEQI